MSLFATDTLLSVPTYEVIVATNVALKPIGLHAFISKRMKQILIK